MIYYISFIVRNEFEVLSKLLYSLNDFKKVKSFSCVEGV